MIIAFLFSGLALLVNGFSLWLFGRHELEHLCRFRDKIPGILLIVGASVCFGLGGVAIFLFFASIAGTFAE